MYKSTLALTAGIILLAGLLLSVPFLYAHNLSFLHSVSHATPSPAPSPSPSPSSSPQPTPVALAPVCVVPDNPGRPRALPCVISVTPANPVADTAVITLSFSQPMDPTSVEKSFVLTPHAPGSLNWLDDFTLNFQPYRFSHGTTYTIQVGGRSVWHTALSGTKTWQFTTSAGPALVIAPGATSIRVPILMYHYIRNNPDPRDILGFNLSVTPADFAAQMNWLASHRYHTITLDDLAAYMAGRRGLPSKPIVLSFDDGYADFYTAALPVLLAHDFTAVAYIVPGFWGDASRYMTPAQVLAINQQGIQVGSHTVNHVNLTTQSNSGLSYQLTSSKASLESLLRHPVLSFCYPSGDFNSRVVAAVENAGYRDATTTQYGAARALYSRYIWGRLRISGGESLSSYAAGVTGAS